MEILSGLQTHPEDGRIIYTPNDRDLIVPLIRNGVIDAAVIPAHPEESHAFAQETWRIQDTQIKEFAPGELSEHFFMRDGRLHEYATGKRLTAEQENEIPLLVRNTFHKLSEFFYPSAVWSPAAEVRRWMHGAADYLLTVESKTRTTEKLANDLGFWLEEKFPRRQTNLMVFWAKSATGKEGSAPALHFDQGITAHISGHSPLEYLVGRITDEQWQTLRRRLGGKKVDRIENDPEVDARVRQLNPGDMVVFGEGFVHRSSPSVREEGELNFAAAPNEMWPDI